VDINFELKFNKNLYFIYCKDVM